MYYTRRRLLPRVSRVIFLIFLFSLSLRLTLSLLSLSLAHLLISCILINYNLQDISDIPYSCIVQIHWKFSKFYSRFSYTWTIYFYYGDVHAPQIEFSAAENLRALSLKSPLRQKKKIKIITTPTKNNIVCMQCNTQHGTI